MFKDFIGDKPFVLPGVKVIPLFRCIDRNKVTTSKFLESGQRKSNDENKGPEKLLLQLKKFLVQK